MSNLRKYGYSPFKIAVIHGGPGAPGEMAPVARELSESYGILEPLQTATTLEMQVDELKTVLQSHGDPPVTLIGHSWGAMLSFIFASKYPAFINKIILVSSGVFESEYAKDIMKTRLSRLNEDEKNEIEKIIKILNCSVDLDKDKDKKQKDKIMERFGCLIAKADAYKPIPHNNEVLECSSKIYQNVWNEAEDLRNSGQLLRMGKKIKCPVVAIHGIYDPHPSQGVKIPLSRVLKDFRFIQLEKCGHTPWIEEFAKDKFYEILEAEIVQI